MNDHALAWYAEKGIRIPDDPAEWDEMFNKWVEWAFSDFAEIDS